MKKQELQNKIKERIFSTVSNIMQEKKKQDRFSAPTMTQEELDRVIFNGNSFEGIQKKFSLREAVDTLPQITSSEIQEFETAMENLVTQIPNASITFDTQGNGYYMDIKMTTQGAEALASGNIHMSNNGSLKWIFSLQDGFKFMSEEPLSVDQDNKNMITQLQDYYAAWQKDWREKLSKSPEDIQTEPEIPDAALNATGGGQMGTDRAATEFNGTQM